MSDLQSKLPGIFEKELVDEIFEVSRLAHFAEGETVLDYGKRITFIPIVLSGTLRVMRKNEDNKEILLYYLSDNESCPMAYVCCMEDSYSSIKVIAEDESDLIMIPNSKFEEWLLKYPGWKNYVFRSFNHRFNELLRSLDGLAFQKLDQRLVNYLRDKSKIAGRNTLKLSHSQIADEMGTSREVISRLLKQLENDKKVILYRNEIKLLNSF